MTAELWILYAVNGTTREDRFTLEGGTVSVQMSMDGSLITHDRGNPTPDAYLYRNADRIQVTFT